MTDEHIAAIRHSLHQRAAHERQRRRASTASKPATSRLHTPYATVETTPDARAHSSARAQRSAQQMFSRAGGVWAAPASPAASPAAAAAYPPSSHHSQPSSLRGTPDSGRLTPHTERPFRQSSLDASPRHSARASAMSARASTTGLRPGVTSALQRAAAAPAGDAMAILEGQVRLLRQPFTLLPLSQARGR